MCIQDEDKIRIGSSDLLEPSGADYWAGFLTAPTWAEIGHSEHNKGIYVELELPEGEGERRPSPTQIAACMWFVQYEAQTVMPVLEAILANYPRLQERYRYEEAEAAQIMPPIITIQDLLPLIELRNLYIRDVVNGDVPYIGFTFGCRWDSEHGLGVLMHGLRAVTVDDGDAAFAMSSPSQDGGTSNSRSGADA